RLHASKTPYSNTFMVNILEYEHTCIRQIRSNYSVISSWITKHLAFEIRTDLYISYELMKQKLLNQYGVSPHPKKLYRARQKAKNQNEGKHNESYSNTSEGPPVFRRMFICYGASKKGFLDGCRPFIGLDGYHLKVPFGGVMLSAISI
ncbi:hypothetical protein CFOL_v3_03285, partial [Cephalotus follicularis]